MYTMVFEASGNGIAGNEFSVSTNRSVLSGEEGLSKCNSTSEEFLRLGRHAEELRDA